jgi:hypothetical protein
MTGWPPGRWRALASIAEGGQGRPGGNQQLGLPDVAEATRFPFRSVYMLAPAKAGS